MTCSGCGRESAPGERQYEWGISDFVDAKATKTWCPCCWKKLEAEDRLVARLDVIDGLPHYQDKLTRFLANEGGPTLQQVQDYRREYEAEVGCCPACGRFDGVTVAGPIPSDIVLMWGGRIDIEAFPRTEGEMLGLIREKLKPVGDAILQAWKERKNG
jgi:hypothetical protein